MLFVPKTLFAEKLNGPSFIKDLKFLRHRHPAIVKESNESAMRMIGRMRRKRLGMARRGLARPTDWGIDAFYEALKT